MATLTDCQPPPTLMSLLTENQLRIIELLETADLLRLESVSHGMRDVVLRAYKDVYGPRPYHRSVDLQFASSFRDLAIEQLKHFVGNGPAIDCSPEYCIYQLLDNWYGENDDFLQAEAETALLTLQRSEDRQSQKWNEAVAISLLAQGKRHDEAKLYLDKLDTSDAKVSGRIFLAAARFGWPQQLPPPPPPEDHHTLNLSLVGAALRGDVVTLKELRELGGRLDLVYCHDTAAAAAARAGQIEVLKFLHSQNISLDIGHEPRKESPLWSAAKYGQRAAAKYLLSIGCQPGSLGQDQSPATAALIMGEVGILRLFMMHEPTVLATHSAQGRLSIAPIFCGCALRLDQRIELLHFLINDAGIDINAVDTDGHAAIHLAARYGSIDLMLEVIGLGADVHALDATGQSAAEISLCENTALVPWLSEETDIEAMWMKSYKQKLAKIILAAQRPLRMQQLATGDFASEFRGETVAQKIVTAEANWIKEQVEDKIADIWMRTYSATAMKSYIEQVLATPIEDAMNRMSLLAAKVQRCSDLSFGIDNGEAHDSLLAMAQTLARELFPAASAIGQFEDRMARAMLLQIPTQELHQIVSYHTTSYGKMFLAGKRTAAKLEMNALTEFIDSIK